MRVLRLRAYYDPERTPGIHLDNDLSEAFMNNNIHYISYTPSPTRGISKELRKYYKDKKKETLYNGFVEINRFSMFREGRNPLQRLIRYIACSIKEYNLGIKTEGIDVVFSSSTPPTQGMLSALVAKRLSKRNGRQVPFVYNLQDVFPDSLVNAGMTKKGSIIWKIGRKIEDYTYKNSNKIIVISDGFKNNIMAKGVPEEKIVVVPNWVNIDNVYPVSRNDNILFDRYNLDRSLFYICYSGNIGHSQNMDLLLDVAKEIELPEVRFVLIGDGAAKEDVQRRIETEKINNVIMLPFQEYSEIAYVFSLGDVGLIISKSGVGGSSVPSKTWSIMAAERPILASFDSDSDLFSLLHTEHCGVLVDSNSKEELIHSIQWMVMNRGECKEMAIRGRKYVVNKLNKNRCVGLYIDTIRSSLET